MRNYLPFIILIASFAVISCTKEPDIDKMKADLIGQRFRLEGFSRWIFESFTEYQDFKILNKLKNDNILEYSTEITARGSAIFVLDTKIVYRKKEDGKWKFVSGQGHEKMIINY